MKLEIKYLNSVRFIKLFIAASRWMSKYSDVLNDLNVYPVPDGDTGTNMSMTLFSVENELIKLNYEPTMPELTDIVSEAILLGARGNSGTILSQIIQGFLFHIKDKELITVDDVADAFVSAKDRAYEAVTNPVEGTMLTVIRRVAEEAKAYTGPKDDFILFLVHIKNVAHTAVEETPNQLKKLKEAGVVDAGGKGIFYMLEGFEKSVTDPEMLKDLERIVKSQASRKEKLETGRAALYENIDFKYCTEFVIESGNISMTELKKQLLMHGDSIVCASTDKKIKTHLHTNRPGNVLELALKYGELSNIKIENMEIQHRNLLLDMEEREEFAHKTEKFLWNKEKQSSNFPAYFAVADNLEMGNLFLSNGATLVLIGGQSQNPSVNDFEEGIKKLESNNIIILPNNKNIISAAKLAAKRTSKDVLVLETKTMLEARYFLKNNNERLEDIIFQNNRNYSIEITKSVRESNLDDKNISKDDYIALVNGNLVEHDSDITNLIKTIEQKYIGDKALNVFVAIGKGSTVEGNSAIRTIKTKIKYKETVIGQENYPYYIYVENIEPNIPEIAVVTDSTSDIPEELVREFKISVVPLKIKIGIDDFYRDGIDMTKEEFWEKISDGKSFPKTSQPSPAEFRNIYEELFDKGYKKIISIHVSGKLSGTLHSAGVARGMLAERAQDISIIDSKTVAFALGFQAVEIAKLVKEKKDLTFIMNRLETLQAHTKIYCVPNNIEFLIRGGRVSMSKGFIAKLFNIKPILKIENGEISPIGKAFGEKNAIKFIKSRIKKDTYRKEAIAITAWGGTMSESFSSEKLRDAIMTLKNIEMREKYQIGSSIGSHSGPVYAVGTVPKI
ncbi:MAG: DegV family protein [Fusobacteriaceae bacterium]